MDAPILGCSPGLGHEAGVLSGSGHLPYEGRDDRLLPLPDSDSYSEGCDHSTAMRLPSHLRHHPLKFLIHLEWILLLVAAIGEIPPLLLYQLPRVLWLNWLGLGLFTLLGMWLPQRSGQRILHTSSGIGLILLLSLVGGIRLFPILFIVLVIRCSFIFKPRTCLVLTGLALALCILVQIYRFQFLTLSPILTNPNGLKQVWLSSIFLAGLTLIFLQLLMYTVMSEKQSRDELAIAHAKLRTYALEIENLAIVQERNRIAREIHDSLGHSLTVFNLHLEAGLRLLDSDPDEARELLTEAKQIGSTALRDVRQSVATLRSDPLEGRSLEAAIAALIDNFQRSTGITPTFQYQVNSPLAAKLETPIYRIVQEALTNICKYAAATQVEVVIESDKTVQVSIRDNGVGFDPAQTTSGFGLQGMQERTLALHGHFQLIAAPDAGCQIVITLPLMLSPL